MAEELSGSNIEGFINPESKEISNTYVDDIIHPGRKEKITAGIAGILVFALDTSRRVIQEMQDPEVLNEIMESGKLDLYFNALKHSVPTAALFAVGTYLVYKYGKKIL